jgi:hypothetical protein
MLVWTSQKLRDVGTLRGPPAPETDVVMSQATCGHWSQQAETWVPAEHTYRTMYVTAWSLGEIWGKNWAPSCRRRSPAFFPAVAYDVSRPDTAPHGGKLTG